MQKKVVLRRNFLNSGRKCTRSGYDIYSHASIRKIKIFLKFVKIDNHQVSSFPHFHFIPFSPPVSSYCFIIFFTVWLFLESLTHPLLMMMPLCFKTPNHIACSSLLLFHLVIQLNNDEILDLNIFSSSQWGEKSFFRITKNGIKIFKKKEKWI